jgi:eukaryotic-like serine/threonine-protein kinase
VSLSPGARLGPYAITGPIGAGGMGEVYKATDTRLERTVAIKVLPEHVASDPDLRQRFEREAKTLAALHHPHICSVFDVGTQEGVDFLVMEYLEGETLADRLARIAGSKDTALRVEQVLRIAVDIADALDKAHRKGIVHRDLKPANVMLTKSGAKLLDFGLAKRQPVSAVVGVSLAATVSQPLTGQGTILGTLHYMPPEQLEGKEADPRSDIFSFGALVYEMATGRKAFEGKSPASVIAAVLEREPPAMSTLQPLTPRLLEHIVARCLAKDPDERWQSIADIAHDLKLVADGAAADSAATSGNARATRHERVAWAAVSALITLVAGGALLWMQARTSTAVSSSSPVVKFAFALPEGHRFTGQTRQAIAISPDGARVAYVANSRLYLRSIGEFEPYAIPGLEPALSATPVLPMFSPDGESIAFFDSPSYDLKRVPIGGGTSTTLARVGALPCGASWGRNGMLIALPPGAVSSEFRQNGGAPEPIVSVGANELACGPQMLPDGQTVLFTVAQSPALLRTWDRPTDDGPWDKAQVVAYSLASGSRRVLKEGASDGRYLSTGHLLYAIAGTMYAAPFDAATLTITGPEVPVIVGVRRSTPGQPTSATQLAISDTGTLVYVPGPATTSTTIFALVVGDNTGNEVRLKVPPDSYMHPRVSPDGRSIAIARNDGKGSDIWTYDLSGITELRKLTFGSNSTLPVWSSDGQCIAFQSSRDGDRGIFWQPLAGGTAQRLTKAADGESHVPQSWSSDGRHLLFSIEQGGTSALHVLTIGSEKHEPFGPQDGGSVRGASFSPDGKWIAYALEVGLSSSESGVFVEPFPATGARYQVPKVFRSFHPVWSPDGRALFYMGGLDYTASVPFMTSPRVDFGTPIELTGLPRPGLQSWQPRGYDVLPDGRFVSVSAAFDDGPAVTQTGGVRVVTNWFEELRRLVPNERTR